MARLLVQLFSLAALVSCTSASEGEQAAMDVALGRDDQCAAADDARQCALKALQVRVTKDAAETGVEVNRTLPRACTSGLVYRMYVKGPECFNRCPQMCGPLSLVVKAYFTRGGSRGAERAICQTQQEWHCSISQANADVCEGWIAKARTFGVTLPASVRDLEEICRRLR